MARIVEFSNHLGRFEPEGPAETAAVKALKDGRWRVGFYLGGRALLVPKPTAVEWENLKLVGRRVGIEVPVSITQTGPPDSLPQPLELWRVAEQALREASTKDRQITSLGSWTVDIRPIRASKPSCLECHNSFDKRDEPDHSPDLRIGDALGVAIYVYALESPR